MYVPCSLDITSMTAPATSLQVGFTYFFHVTRCGKAREVAVFGGFFHGLVKVGRTPMLQSQIHRFKIESEKRY
jgi:hypothetical protein